MRAMRAQWSEAGFQSFDYDAERGAIAFGFGFVTSGVSALAVRGVTSVGTRAGVNAVVGGTGNAAQTTTMNYVEGKDDLSEGVAESFFTGFAFGGIGSSAGDGLVGFGRASSSRGMLTATTPGGYNLFANILENSGQRAGVSGLVGGLGAQGSNIFTGLGNTLNATSGKFYK